MTVEEKKLAGIWYDDTLSSKTEIKEKWGWIEFKNDGTYNRQYFTTWEYGGIKTVEMRVKQKGEFKVVGDKIITSNILETSIKIRPGATGREYINRPVEEQDWKYKFADISPSGIYSDYTCLWLNHFPDTLGDYEGYVKR